MGDSGGSSSNLEVKEYPSAYGTTDYSKSSELAKLLESMMGSGDSKISSAYKTSVLNPSTTPDTVSERHLINSILDRTGKTQGASTYGTSGYNEIAKAIFPNLVDLRKDRTTELAKATSSELNTKSTKYQTLMELIGLAMPQLVGGYNQNTSGGSNNSALISAFGNLASSYAGTGSSGQGNTTARRQG